MVSLDYCVQPHSSYVHLKVARKGMATPLNYSNAQRHSFVAVCCWRWWM